MVLVWVSIMCLQMREKWLRNHELVCLLYTWIQDHFWKRVRRKILLLKYVCVYWFLLLKKVVPTGVSESDHTTPLIDAIEFGGVQIQSLGQVTRDLLHDDRVQVIA